MIFIRAQMIGNSGWGLARAATIAIRYATVRRQFADAEATGPEALVENQVINYPSVHMRLLPLLAQAYAFIVRDFDFDCSWTHKCSLPYHLDGGQGHGMSEAGTKILIQYLKMALFYRSTCTQAWPRNWRVAIRPSWPKHMRLVQVLKAT